MALFDAFTGDPAKAAAEASRNYLGTAQNNLVNATALTRDQIEQLLLAGYANAGGNLGAAYDAAGGALRGGAGRGLGYIDDGMSDAAQSLQGARDALTANGGAYAPLGELADRHGEGSRLYADALGINGAEGVARARAAFQGGPGWTTQLDASLDALNRRRNAAGSLFSGNADADAIKLGSDYADKGWQQWLAGLSPYNQLESSATAAAATGNAGINSTLANLGVGEANLRNDAGKTRATIATNEGVSLADIANRYYGALAGLDTGGAAALGANIADANKSVIGIGTNLAPQITKTYKDAADAEIAGSGLLWKLGADLAKAYMKK
jgi:hypothetical protein